MQPKLLTTLFAVALITGCRPAVWVVQPGDSVSTPLTTFSVQFHEYYQPGTFKAFLDGHAPPDRVHPAMF